MHGMRLSHLANPGTPPVVTPIPSWGIRQSATSEGGSQVQATLPVEPIGNSLLIGVGFYGRGTHTMGPIAWSQLISGWTLLTSRQTNVGSSQFERGIFFYGRVIAEAPSHRNIRFTTGWDCDDVGPGEIGEGCDTLRAAIVELVPPAGISSYEDPAALNNSAISGDNGPMANGLVVLPAAWGLIPSAGLGYLVVATVCWRAGGPPMSQPVWDPGLVQGGLLATGPSYGVSINFGIVPGGESYAAQATFDSGSNSGLSMAVVGIDFG